MFAEFSEGLDTDVGRMGSKLSGGQRQVVWVLRVLLRDPPILLLDEPTSALDEGTKAIVQNLLQVAMKGRTVLMVTHDAFLKKYADRIIELTKGEVVSDTATRV